MSDLRVCFEGDKEVYEVPTRKAKKQAKGLQDKAKAALDLSAQLIAESESESDDAKALELATRAAAEAEKASSLSEAAKKLVKGL